MEEIWPIIDPGSVDLSPQHMCTRAGLGLGLGLGLVLGLGIGLG